MSGMTMTATATTAASAAGLAKPQAEAARDSVSARRLTVGDVWGVPRLGWPGGERPRVFDVMHVLAKQPAAPWVREVYIDKFERGWLHRGTYRGEDDLARLITLLDALPEGPALKEKYADFLLFFAPATQPAATQPGGPR